MTFSKRLNTCFQKFIGSTSMPRHSSKVEKKSYETQFEGDNFKNGRERTSKICYSMKTMRTLVKIAKIHSFKTSKLNQRPPTISGAFIQGNELNLSKNSKSHVAF